MRGFTLIELLVYIGLYALLVGGTSDAVLAMRDAAERADSRAQLLSEGTVLLAALERHAEEGDAMAAFSVEDGALIQARDSGPARLTGTDIRISDLSFAPQAASGSDPESIVIRFTLHPAAYGESVIAPAFEARIYPNPL
jgi:type II secretory pathway pseudopilin PulG